MPNIYDRGERSGAQERGVRLDEEAGCERLGMSRYAPGQGMIFHYHLQREELLVVLEGELALRTADGWTQLPRGEVVAFPRGEHGAHGYENRMGEVVSILVISEQNAPNVTVYPDENQVGIFDAARRDDRRFGALFDVEDAIADYGGGNAKAKIVPPASPPRSVAPHRNPRQSGSV